MSADQVVIAGVGLEPKRERGTDDRDQTDELIDQDVERHAAKNNLRDLSPDAVNNYGHRHQCNGDVTKTWNQIDNRIQAEALLKSRDADQSIHYQRNQLKGRFDRTAWLPIFGRKNLPLKIL